MYMQRADKDCLPSTSFYPGDYRPCLQLPRFYDTISCSNIRLFATPLCQTDSLNARCLDVSVQVHGRMALGARCAAATFVESTCLPNVTGADIRYELPDLSVEEEFPNGNLRAEFENLSDEAYEALMIAEIGRLRSLINDEAVRRLASSLNKDRYCTVEYSSKIVGSGALMGCANYHARIRFDDGSPSWLIRVPQITGFAVGLPVPLAEYLICSEYATLKFLETTAVPAPRAFAFGIPSQGTDHGVGVCFLMMEELPGKPWDGQGDATNIWKAVAEVLDELAKHPFQQAGSLHVDPSTNLPSVSAVASDRFVCLDPHGPFETSGAYYAAWAEQHLVLIADGQLYPQFPVEAYLVYRFLRHNAINLSDCDNNEFFLKHVDDKGDHILVDEDLNVTGIIDWQMARIVPRREAFSLSLVTADMSALCGGKSSLSTKDIELRDVLRGKRPGLASYMEDEKMRRCFWGLRLETEWKYALPLATAILWVFGVRQSWEEWSTLAMRTYRDDDRLKKLVEVSRQGRQ